MRPFVKKHLDSFLKGREDTEINFVPFWGGVPDIKGVLDISCLSNWFYRDMTYQGHVFLTAEHAMMWSKANYFNDTDAKQRILKVKTPREAKMIGREVRNFNQHRWSEDSYPLVGEVVHAKFTSISFKFPRQHYIYRSIPLRQNLGRWYGSKPCQYLQPRPMAR